MEDFLRDEDIHLSVHPTTIPMSDQNSILDYAVDIDGVVAELAKIAAVKIPLPYVTFQLPSKRNMKPVFHLIKKHIQLHQYSSKGLQCLKASKGIHLANSLVSHTLYSITTLAVGRAGDGGK